MGNFGYILDKSYEVWKNKGGGAWKPPPWGGKSPVPPPASNGLAALGKTALLGVGIWAIWQGLFPGRAEAPTVYDKGGNFQPWITDIPEVREEVHVILPPQEIHLFGRFYSKNLSEGGCNVWAKWRTAYSVVENDVKSETPELIDGQWAIPLRDGGSQPLRPINQTLYDQNNLGNTSGRIQFCPFDGRCFNQTGNSVGDKFIFEKAVPIPPNANDVEEVDWFSEAPDSFPPTLSKLPKGYIFPGSITYTIPAPKTKSVEPPFELTGNDVAKLTGGLPDAIFIGDPSPTATPAPPPSATAPEPGSETTEVEKPKFRGKITKFDYKQGFTPSAYTINLGNPTGADTATGQKTTTKFESSLAPVASGGGGGAVQEKPVEEQLQEQLEAAVNPDGNTEGAGSPATTPVGLPKSDTQSNFDPQQLKDAITKDLIDILPALVLAPLSPPLEQLQKNTAPATVQSAAASAICSSTKPGGCMNKDLLQPLQKGQRGIQDFLKNNVLGAVNGLQNASILTIVKDTNSIVKNAETGVKATFNFAKKAWETLPTKQAMDAITFVASVHNASMLSQNAAQSLGDAASSALELVGIKNPATGERIDVNQALGQTVRNLIAKLVGEQNLNTLGDYWLKLNRIHQAVGATCSAIVGTKNAMLEADEITGGNLAKLANSLQEQGIVEDNSYPYMDENPDYKTPFGGVLGFIDKVDDFGNRVSSVVNTGLEIQQSTGELITSTSELKKTIDDANLLKQEEQSQKDTESTSPNIDRLDLLKQETDDDASI